MSVAEEVQALESKHILQLYRRNPLVLVRGKGVRLYDADGREYIDLLSGIGVSSLGYGHPGLAAAIADQAQTLLHTSNLFFHPLQGQVAERLAALSGLPRVFLCNSGAEAVEASLKFARRYWHTLGDKGRTQIISLDESFHGRTFGALSVTSDAHYREPFEPLLPGATFLTSNDPAALAAATSTATAAIIVEAIQGEGGVRPLTPAFAAAIREACERTGALLICDEIQCGLGRTGYPFHYAALGLEPDLVTVGKNLGAGVPVGATLVGEEVARAIFPGDHGSTYGGNLLACRAALVYLDEIISGGLLAHIVRVGHHMERGLRALAARHRLVADVRGSGLMWGLQLKIDAAPAVPAALRRGLIINRTAGTVIRMLPPLVITEADIDEALIRLDATLTEVGEEVTA